MCIRVCKCMHVCMYVYVSIYAYVCTCMCMGMYVVCMGMYVCTCMCMGMYVRIQCVRVSGRAYDVSVVGGVPADGRGGGAVEAGVGERVEVAANAEGEGPTHTTTVPCRGHKALKERGENLFGHP